MTHDEKVRLTALVALPLGQLTIVDLCFVVRMICDHPDEAGALVPGLSYLLDAA